MWTRADRFQAPCGQQHLADEEIKKLWESMDAIAAGNGDPVLLDTMKAPRLVVAGAVKLLLLLGTRRSETLNMRWADLGRLADYGVAAFRMTEAEIREDAQRA